MRICLLFALFMSTFSSPGQYPCMSSLQMMEYDLPIKDSVKTKLTVPQKAALFSAVLPGTGQIYNKKYWKAGIVYLGAAGLIYMYKSNRDSMLAYQEAYRARIDNDPLTVDNQYSRLSDNSVASYRNFHRRLRDISILSFAGLYALQIIDANVDAHLREFKVNKDLSLRLRPMIGISPAEGIKPGLSLRIGFR